ncbi:peptidase associated/transthyretin-like domain-containing protein [Kribbella monticola]|uniref:3,4-dioxygenase subunit beta n=1 Tax=Kribbella monticola TaxID=2185285 RepID=UPI000DD4DD34|nr:3,4-dioxygenase subunit beta [Kribbella monticola]
MTHDHEHDLGLVHDLGTLRRRNVLRLFAGAGIAAVAGCAADTTGTANKPTTPTTSTTSSSATPSTSTTPSTSASTPSDCVQDIPEETAGPYPAVYVWHCDALGRYSMYDDEISDENYLRGVQAAGAQGKVTFTTVFPAAYQGRWPHIHFEVYASLSEATAAGKISATSQLALPEDVCKTVYATSGYDGSTQNLAQTSLQRDMVFGDDSGVHQLAAVTGSVQDGYLAQLTVGV